MKTTFISSLSRNAVSLALCLLLALMATGLQSCSDKADATDLLRTVPAGASMVAVGNVEKILTKSDCKVDGDKIEAGKQVKALIPKIENVQLRQLAQTFFSGESGVATDVMVVFQNGYYTYLTGFVSDTDKFKATVQKDFSATFQNADGVDVADNVAMYKGQFWVNLGQHIIDPLAVKGFTTLDDERSFLSNQMAKQLAEVDKDIEGWGSLQGLLATAPLEFQQRATAQVLIESVFENAVAVSFSAQFDKGELTVEASVLNAKGGMAKSKLAGEKIDAATLASLKGKADALAAIALSEKTIANLRKDSEKGAPSMVRVYLSALGCINGTSAIAFDSGMKAAEGVVSLNSQNAGELEDMIHGALKAKTWREGTLLHFQTNPVVGRCNVAELAPMLDGAMAGIVTTGNPDGSKLGKAVKQCALTLIPKDSGLSIRLKAQGYNAKEEFLLTLLKAY